MNILPWIKLQTSLSSSVNLKLNPPAPTTAEGLPW